MKRILNIIVLLIVIGVVVALLTMWLRPDPLRVNVTKASRGPMRVTVNGEGKTRVRDRYVVAAPVAGRLRRINLRRGDKIIEHQLIAEIEPLPLAPLDPRQRAEATGRVRAAEDARAEVDRLVERYKASYEQARRDLKRSEVLARDGVVSRQEVEAAETAVATALREYEAVKSRAEKAAHDVEVARAALLAINRSPAAATVRVQAPTAGRVLQVLEESERVIGAGAPLVELSNPSRLEVVIELLSTDAVKVSSGATVLIENWGGPKTLEARVRLIEPSAFTKVSALGVEEQRVNVIADLAEAETTLGDGYRVEGRVVIWETTDALRVPVSALFRRGESWSLFQVENGTAEVKDVEIGHLTPSEAEVISGLEEGAEVITYPSKDLSNGTRVEQQTGRNSPL
jgi:HlyD family secretion protein